MIRLGLTICLMLTTAAGPMLCCCSIQASPPPVTTSQAAPPPPAEECPACCSHKHKHAAPKTGTSRPAKPAEQPACPCKRESSRSATGLPPASDVAWRLPLGDSLDASLAPPTGVALPIGLTRPTLRNNATFPFLTATDMLRALHILRC